MAGLLAWRNYIDSATLSSTSAIDPAHPLANLKLRGLSRGMRVTSGAGFTITANFAAADALDLGVIALLGLNRRNGERFSGTMTIQRSTNGSTWSTLDTVSISDNARSSLPANFIYPLAAGAWSASGWPWLRVTWATGGTELGALARLWAGPALVLPDGVDAGWQMGFRDSGSLDATDGQQWVASPGVRTRVLTIPLESARDTETTWGFSDTAGTFVAADRMSLQALQLEAGTTGEVIACPRTSSPLWAHRAGVYGHIEQPWAIGHQSGPYWGAGLTVVEER